MIILSQSGKIKLVVNQGPYIFPSHISFPKHIHHPVTKPDPIGYVDLYKMGENFRNVIFGYEYIGSYMLSDRQCLDLLKEQIDSKTWQQLEYEMFQLL